MTICYLTNYYSPFLNKLSLKHSGFLELNYQQTLNLTLSELYADTGSICHYSKLAGNDAHIIIQNFEILQKKWALENNIHYTNNNWQEEIALAQLKKWKIEVFYTESIPDHSSDFLIEIKKFVFLTVAWISFPFESLPNLDKINLILTSTQYYQTKFKNMGLQSEYMLPAFDSRILDKLTIDKKHIPFSFIGGISESHKQRWEALNYLCSKTNLQIWGYGLPALPNSPIKRLLKKDVYASIRKTHKGELWGMEMYQTLCDSFISFNIHEALLNGKVGNMRLFEATGVGTALLNDNGSNLTQLFEPDKEIIVYNSLPEAVEKLNYYLKKPDLLIEIGKNAQLRTLNDYNYTNNTQQMIGFIKNHLKN
jgi:spore maturation protein CgeB